MMVFGCGPNIEMFEFQHAQQQEPQSLQDIGFTHISFYIESDAFEHVLERVKQAGGKPYLNHILIQNMRIQRIIKLFIFERHGEA